MNLSALITNLQVMCVNSRQIGKTTAAVELVKKSGGIFVAMSHKEAERVKKEYGVETLCIFDLQKQKGRSQPIIIDQDASLALLRDCGLKLDQCESEIKEIQRQINALGEMFDEFERSINQRNRKNFE